MKWIAAILVMGMAVVSVVAQTPAPGQKPAFEAASIKPGEPNERRRGIGFRGNQFEVINFPVKSIIGFAYDVQTDQIFGGPKWIDSDLFSIEAKPSATTPLLPSEDPRQLEKSMIQSLLEERFKLALHRETRIELIYELVVAKGGSKLKESAGPDANGVSGLFGRGPNSGDWTATNVGIANLARMLSQELGSPVSDKTGLTGKYDFKLTYTPQSVQQATGVTPTEISPSDSRTSSVFTALQEQLGLKLESTRGPVEVLVIDSVSKPSEN